MKNDKEIKLSLNAPRNKLLVLVTKFIVSAPNQLLFVQTKLDLLVFQKYIVAISKMTR